MKIIAIQWQNWVFGNSSILRKICILLWFWIWAHENIVLIKCQSYYYFLDLKYLPYRLMCALKRINHFIFIKFVRDELLHHWTQINEIKFELIRLNSYRHRLLFCTFLRYFKNRFNLDTIIIGSQVVCIIKLIWQRRCFERFFWFGWIINNFLLRCIYYIGQSDLGSLVSTVSNWMKISF